MLNAFHISQMINSDFHIECFDKGHFTNVHLRHLYRIATLIVWLEPRDVFDGGTLLFVTHVAVVTQLHAQKSSAGGDCSEVSRVTFQLRERSVANQLDELGSILFHLKIKTKQ